jgi:sulfur relay (sulfurtransferase) DsrC/TusE family protein
MVRIRRQEEPPPSKGLSQGYAVVISTLMPRMHHQFRPPLRPLHHRILSYVRDYYSEAEVSYANSYLLQLQHSSCGRHRFC